MTPQEFEYLATLLKKRSGLALGRDKDYLLESRLRSVARKYNHDDIGDMVRALKRTAPSEEVLREITEAMTTNESMFFRDTKPFVSLREKLLPAITHVTAANPVKIWSAACSYGQEPYSLAMLMEELGQSNYHITATDLDTQALKKAQEGIYTQFEVQRGLQIQLLLKYFQQRESNTWQINDALKQHIRFKQFNLLDEFSGFDMFDVIMCRNVLIYFDEATKKDVLSRMAAKLAPHGVLFLGSAETVIGMCDELKPLIGEPGIYVRQDSTLSIAA